MVKDDENGASEAVGEAATKAKKKKGVTKDPRINSFRSVCTKWLSCLSSRLDLISCLGMCRRGPLT